MDLSTHIRSSRSEFWSHLPHTMHQGNTIENVFYQIWHNIIHQSQHVLSKSPYHSTFQQLLYNRSKQTNIPILSFGSGLQNQNFYTGIFFLFFSMLHNFTDRNNYFWLKQYCSIPNLVNIGIRLDSWASNIAIFMTHIVF